MTQYERNLIDIICPAIKAKKLVRFWYNDKTEDKIDWRIIEPHQIGKLRPEKSKDESIILTGWFLPTQDQVWKCWDENWKNYIVERISKVEILEQSYRLTRMGYQPEDKKRMSIVYCATSERVI